MAPEFLQAARVVVLGQAKLALDALQLAIAAVSLHQRAHEKLRKYVQRLVEGGKSRRQGQGEDEGKRGGGCAEIKWGKVIRSDDLFYRKLTNY